MIETELRNRKQRVGISGRTFHWTPVTNGVSHGSVILILQFIIYINCIVVGIDKFIAKFTDITKLGNFVISDHNRHENLHKTTVWSDR